MSPRQMKRRAARQDIELPNGLYHHRPTRTDVTYERIVTLAQQGLGPTGIAKRLKTQRRYVYHRVWAVVGRVPERYPWHAYFNRQRREKLIKLCKLIRILASFGLDTGFIANLAHRSPRFVQKLNRRFNLGLPRR